MASTVASRVKIWSNGSGVTTNTTDATTVNTPDNANAAQPPSLTPAASRRPTAWPTRTAAAELNPYGTMKTKPRC